MTRPIRPKAGGAQFDSPGILVRRRGMTLLVGDPWYVRCGPARWFFPNWAEAMEFANYHAKICGGRRTG